MKKILLAICLVFFWLNTAFAGHWVRTGVFDPGQYIACAVLDGIPLECFLTIAEGTEAEAQQNVDALNGDTLDIPGWEIYWYRWDNGYWIKYKLPWKFIEGDLM